VDASDRHKRFIERRARDYCAEAMEYLRNAWYVAAWSEELAAGKLIARTFLDEPVVLFRTNDGAAAALFDRCPHRFAPLSRGRHKGSEIECGYHGLRFDRSGACSLNPYNPGHTPPRARVQSYPVLERQGRHESRARLPETGRCDELAHDPRLLAHTGQLPALDR
jgi:phenylpropionate dioxygenase-like ring-hydroxylating dioxygenase large terminal subunit